MTYITALKDAARRTANFAVQHGILAEWRISEVGLTLTAKSGPDKVEKTVSWSEIELSSDPSRTLELAELGALAGLSS